MAGSLCFCSEVQSLDQLGEPRPPHLALQSWALLRLQCLEELLKVQVSVMPGWGAGGHPDSGGLGRTSGNLGFLTSRPGGCELGGRCGRVSEGSQVGGSSLK